MNKQLIQRNRFLESQLALYTSRPVDDVASGLALRISDRGSPSSFGGGPSSPASTQSEPVYVKSEGQDDIDQIIAPTRHLHVRTPFFIFIIEPHSEPVLRTWVLQLGDNELELYGPTSIFRLAPRSPERRTFSDEIAGNGSTDAYRLLSQANPVQDAEIDWARHLPQEVPLTRVEHDRCARLLRDRVDALRPHFAHN